MPSSYEQKQVRGPRFPRVTEQPVSWGLQNKSQTAEGYKAIVDADTGKVFSIVSKEYKIITHQHAIEQIESIISKKADLGSYDVKVNFYNDGGRMRCTFTFPKMAAEIVKGDFVNLQLHLSNSYDVTWPFTVILGALRLVCTNGLVVGEKLLHIRKRHVYELNHLNIDRTIITATQQFQKQSGKWKDLDQIPLHPTTNDGFPTVSLWTFYNAITWYITHRAVSLNHQVEMEHRMRTAMAYLREARNGSRKRT